MFNPNKAVFILGLGNENAMECTQLLEEHGYQVEVSKNFDVVTHLLKSHQSDRTVKEFNNPLELKSSSHKLKKDNGDMLIDKTCDYLQKNIHRKLSLNEIALLMGSNRSKLAASFKAVFGVGVFEWLRKERMFKAKSLLIHSELSVQEVGFEVGYENSSFFSTAYKKEFDLSPRQQRNLSKVRIVTNRKVIHT